MPYTTLNKYLRRLQSIDATRKRMEILYANRKILLSDISVVYESLFLRVVVGFEQFCESLFLNILENRILYSKNNIIPRITCKSRGSLREILLRRDKYFDWLPYRQTEERAKLYLVDGRPFTNLEDREKNTLITITTIRNVIAHSSDYSIRKFRQTVIGNQPLLKSEKNPSGFLRSQISNSPVQMRFEVYAAELGGIAGKIFGKPIRKS